MYALSTDNVLASLVWMEGIIHIIIAIDHGCNLFSDVLVVP